MPVTRAVIPAAGFGTRFLPVTKAVPKELLPVMGRPVIDFVVSEAIDAGCTEILIVISRGKEAIQRYFSAAPELEERLANANRHTELELVRAPGRGASISFVYQREQRGLGDAVLCGREFAGDQPFLVLLGDAILDPGAAADLVAAHDATGGSAVAVERVEADAVNRYGVVAPLENDPPKTPAATRDNGAARLGASRPAATHGGADPWKPGVPVPLSGLVEKPEADRAPSRYAIAARYLFTAELWPLLESTRAGLGGEVQLTDAMDAIARGGSRSAAGHGICAVPIRGTRYDLGNPDDFLRAEIALSGYTPRL